MSTKTPRKPAKKSARKKTARSGTRKAAKKSPKKAARKARRGRKARSVRKSPTRRRRRTSKTRRARIARFVSKRAPTRRTRQRWWRRAVQAPPLIKWPAVGALAIALFFALNWTYQVVRKPSELFFPISGSLHKMPAQTWSAYSDSFREHSTEIITPDFLAALAQVEAAGNPIARTYWRWSNSLNPFDVYRPASSAVGMYQFSDGTFAEAREYCIRDHQVVSDGPWDDADSCWVNWLYTRVLPSHSIELASAYLDVKVRQALRLHPVPDVSLEDKQELAAIIHLCGAGAGRQHARRGLAIPEGKHCGTHDLWRYLEKVRVQQKQFRKIIKMDRAR